MPPKTIAYWVCTGLFCLMFSYSGVAHLLRVESFAEELIGLGYPPYMLTILGSAKLLGAIALIIPGKPLLKEWAYAGFTFDLLGAVASHVFAGDPIGAAAPPAVVLCLAAASYLLRPIDRRLSQSVRFGGAVPELESNTHPSAG